MTKKERVLSVIGVVLLTIVVCGCIFNVVTYNSMKKHAGYTYGIIVDVRKRKRSSVSKFLYFVNGKKYIEGQGGWRPMYDTVLVMFDSTNPQYSMIVDYPHPLTTDHNNKLVRLDTSLVRYEWLDYLPGD